MTYGSNTSRSPVKDLPQRQAEAVRLIRYLQMGGAIVLLIGIIIYVTLVRDKRREEGPEVMQPTAGPPPIIVTTTPRDTFSTEPSDTSETTEPSTKPSTSTSPPPASFNDLLKFYNGKLDPNCGLRDTQNPWKPEKSRPFPSADESELDQPWYVAIYRFEGIDKRFPFEYACSAVLVGPEWVLTEGTCAEQIKNSGAVHTLVAGPIPARSKRRLVPADRRRAVQLNNIFISQTEPRLGLIRLVVRFEVPVRDDNDQILINTICLPPPSDLRLPPPRRPTQSGIDFFEFLGIRLRLKGTEHTLVQARLPVEAINSCVFRVGPQVIYICEPYDVRLELCRRAVLGGPLYYTANLFGDSDQDRAYLSGLMHDNRKGCVEVGFANVTEHIRFIANQV